MKTSTSTTLDAKGLIRTVTEHRLTRAEKIALCAIPEGRFTWDDWEGMKAFSAFQHAGLVETTRLELTPLGLQMVDKLNWKGV